jgi:hypothetical protein
MKNGKACGGLPACTAGALAVSTTVSRVSIMYPQAPSEFGVPTASPLLRTYVQLLQSSSLAVARPQAVVYLLGVYSGLHYVRVKVYKL